MRAILVGSSPQRDRLRARIGESITVVAEFATIRDARAAAIDADAIVVATDKEELAEPDVAEALTRRELQVLELLAEGLPNKTIATRLGISDQTVKFHVAAILGKLGAANRTEAVRWAVRRGLISL